MEKRNLPENNGLEVPKKPAFLLLEMAAIAIESWEDIYNGNYDLIGSVRIPQQERHNAILEKEKIIRVLPEKLQKYALDYDEIEDVIVRLNVYIEWLNEIRDSGRPLAIGIDYLGHSNDQNEPSEFSKMANKLNPLLK